MEGGYASRGGAEEAMEPGVAVCAVLEELRREKGDLRVRAGVGFLARERLSKLRLLFLFMLACCSLAIKLMNQRKINYKSYQGFTGAAAPPVKVYSKLVLPSSSSRTRPAHAPSKQPHNSALIAAHELKALGSADSPPPHSRQVS